LETTTRGIEICREFDFYWNVEKYRKKLELVSGLENSSKVWLESIRLCEKIQLIFSGMRVQRFITQTYMYRSKVMIFIENTSNLYKKAMEKFEFLGKNFTKSGVDTFS
jgi:hypothetical protein